MKRYPLLLLLTLPLLAQFKLEPMPNPAGDASLQPNWSTAPDGSAVLSWIEPLKDGSYTLRYAVRTKSGWSSARTIVEHRRFFRHPAEAPEIIALNDHQWVAHWIENPKEESEAEFVYVSASTDGLKWTSPVLAHKDRTEVEHGLASMVPSGTGEASLLWLFTPKGEDGPAYLMRTIVDASGKATKEERLDADVCTCCPTASAKTAKGFIVAYRDHTPDDIRDIAVVRFEGGKWSPSKIVHADNWKINACPVNAASLATKGDHVAIAWYTGAQNAPKVQVAFSEDGGATFGKSVVASTGHSFGYASVVLDDDGSAIVSWLERKDDGSARVLTRRIAASGTAGPVLQIAEGGQQSLGYPRLLHSGGETFAAWGNAKPGSKIQTARLVK